MTQADRCLFKDFLAKHLHLTEATLWYRYGGNHCLPLLRLHGHPCTHATCHAVARALVPDFCIVCPDLRGYGRATDASLALKRVSDGA